jgi:hypothetical protein
VSAPAADGCAPVGDLHFVCNLISVFDNATSTVQVGQTLWFGTFRGDRMAYMPAPHP